MIAVEGLVKRFGARTVLDCVTFTVGRGEIVGFLGPNGAGKTTTLRILAGYLEADAGRVVLGGPVAYLPESVPLYGDMRVEEYLRYRARLKGVPAADVAACVDDALARAGVQDARRRLIGRLSRGYRQRVGLADALVARPPILILDEPSAGLDPNQLRQFRAQLRELAGERTVLLSSHSLPEVEAVADRIVILVRGRVVAEGTPAALRARLGAGAVLVAVVPQDVDRAYAVLGAEAEIVDRENGRLRVRRSAEAVARALVEEGIVLRELRAEERSLEDVFAEVTR